MKLIIICALLFASSFSFADVEVGDVPPSYLGKNRNGDKVHLREMTGKVVVATFWASWCPPCLKELPILESIQRQIGKDKLEVVAINYQEDKKVFRKLKSQMKKMEITITHDARGTISKRFGVDSLPHMFIIDPRGKVAKVHIGYGESSQQKIVDELNELLTTDWAVKEEATSE
ncbi:TlpA disulfide reductase family protein [Brumicola blandensis]|uniref:TlpA disulfide reductase family protein n=1 Tax=Brumicola blandensis TaxID=3075611 RepID=A0AAW8R8D3_9ALTE|nr:TlpA disulfide reductase family protein [Alteromonas sp. W409]MDT0583453.1 TlpA disulfide reductase family protein [Alteromonas sp. W409]